MKCALFSILLALAACSIATAQGPTITLIHVQGAPYSKCSPDQVVENDLTGDLYDCYLGLPHLTGNAGGPITAPSVTTSGTNGGITGTEGTGATLIPSTAVDLFWPDLTLQRWAMNNHNGGKVAVVGIATAGTPGHLAVLASNGVDITDGGAAGGGGSTGAIPIPPTRWGLIGYQNNANAQPSTGIIAASGNTAFTCTTPTVQNVSATNPPYQICASGTVANTAQFEVINPNATDLHLGATLSIVAQAGQNSTTAIRSWFAFISDQSTTNVKATDGTGNFAGIRFSSVAGDTNFMLVLCRAGTCATTSTGVAGDTALHVFSTSLNPGTSTATGCVDATCVTQTTDYPNGVGANAAGVLVDNTTTTSKSALLSSVFVSSKP